jgi:hypothetical protein
MEVFPFELLNQEHGRIMVEAGKCGVTLRLLGALAFELRCPQQVQLRHALGRQLSDLDYIGLSKQWDDVVKLLTGMGYSFDERRAMLHGHERLIFFHPSEMRVDIFFDRLDMCHTIDFRNRLAIHDETLSLADLLLEKLQIVKITEKDIIDMIVFFIEHPITEDESGINGRYICERFSWDWGFYKTATTNLQRVRDEFLPRYDLVGKKDSSMAKERIDRLLNSIEAFPKSVKWMLRSKVGTKVQWYKDVGELVR